MIMNLLKMYLEENLHILNSLNLKTVSYQALAEKYGLSETTIKNYFRNVYGYGYKDYQKKVRMEKAADMLKNSKFNIDEISLKVGYLSHTKFSTAFKEYYGVTPSQYRLDNKIKKTEDNV